MIRQTYAVFTAATVGVFPYAGGRWQRYSNKQRALRYARANAGYVTAMPLAAAGKDAWDGPTFRACSEIIADFRVAL